MFQDEGGSNPAQGRLAMSAIEEPWITRYSAEGNPFSNLHYDTRSNVTVNVMLSASGDYEGGGTFFQDTQETVRLDAGQVLLHPGRLVHKSIPVTKGTRYILVCFTSWTGVDGERMRA